jgi:colicin import membrane protein
MRQENLKAMAGLAGSGGSGTAEKSSGPNGGKGTGGGTAGHSAGYGARVAAKVKPNIVYPDMVSGNPRAEVRVRAAPDGTITGVQLVTSSGNKAWDDAVVRALHKTDVLPKDTNGKVPSEFLIGFRPQD